MMVPAVINDDDNKEFGIYHISAGFEFLIFDCISFSP